MRFLHVRTCLHPKPMPGALPPSSRQTPVQDSGAAVGQPSSSSAGCSKHRRRSTFSVEQQAVALHIVLKMTIDLTNNANVASHEAAEALTRLPDATKLDVLSELLRTSEAARVAVKRKADAMESRVGDVEVYRGKAEQVMQRYKQGAKIVEKLNALMTECSQLPPAQAFRAMARVIDTTVMKIPMRHASLLFDSSLPQDFGSALLPVIKRMSSAEVQRWEPECGDMINTANANMDRKSLRKAMNELGKRRRGV